MTRTRFVTATMDAFCHLSHPTDAFFTSQNHDHVTSHNQGLSTQRQDSENIEGLGSNLKSKNFAAAFDPRDDWPAAADRIVRHMLDTGKNILYVCVHSTL